MFLWCRKCLDVSVRTAHQNLHVTFAQRSWLPTKSLSWDSISDQGKRVMGFAARWSTGFSRLFFLNFRSG